MAEIVPVLEQAAQEFADATAKPPFLFDYAPEEGRKIVDSVQDGDIPAPAVDVTDLIIAGGPSGEVSIKIYRPAGSAGVLPVLLFTQGAGWVFGDAHTHDRLVRELTVRAGVATVFTNYSLSPEATRGSPGSRPGHGGYMPGASADICGLVTLVSLYMILSNFSKNHSPSAFFSLQSACA